MKTNHTAYRALPAMAACCFALLAATSCLSPPREGADEGPFTFIQLCDTQLGFGDYQQDLARFTQAVTQINTLRPDFVVICGDLVNAFNEESVADFRRTQAQLTVPCHSAPGNHDVGNKPTQVSLEQYRRALGRDYTSFRHRGWVFVVVNTSLWKSPLEDESGRQDAWLGDTLRAAADDGSPVVVVGHHPLFVATADEPEQYYNVPLPKRTELLGLFETSGVAAVLSGHTHKLLINEYKGMQLVSGETTSRAFDSRPFGFRLWHVGENGTLRHEFIPLEDI